MAFFYEYRTFESFSSESHFFFVKQNSQEKPKNFFYIDFIFIPVSFNISCTKFKSFQSLFNNLTIFFTFHYMISKPP